MRSQSEADLYSVLGVDIHHRASKVFNDEHIYLLPHIAPYHRRITVSMDPPPGQNKNHLNKAVRLFKTKNTPLYSPTPNLVLRGVDDFDVSFDII